MHHLRRLRSKPAHRCCVVFCRSCRCIPIGLYRQSLDGIQPQSHQEMKCSTGRQLKIEWRGNARGLCTPARETKARRSAGRAHFDRT
ncbi:hypothetical protein BSLA_02f3436 [Burkholderia stabilis]|nr:hypothetical protein BSLA_02f3436 [Burkholderia stabilis]